MKLAFIGLGVMGFPMAGHLAQQGHDVTVFNRTRRRAEQWQSLHGGAIAETPRHAADGATAVMCCVGDDNDVRSVILGDSGVLAGLESGAILVDHTTASATLARELAEACSGNGIGFLDAPVSGGQAGAENGALTIMVGGDPALLETVSPALDCYARSVKHLGPAGSGQLAKMVNQICIAGVVQGLAEGLQFAEKAGLDPAAVVDAISKGAAQSWQMENRYQTMLAGEYDHGFAVDWMRKDLAMVQEQAANMDLDLPLTTMVDQFYADVQSMGGGRWDTSSLLARLKAEDKRDGD